MTSLHGRLIAVVRRIVGRKFARWHGASKRCVQYPAGDERPTDWVREWSVKVLSHYKQECTHREQTSADPDDPDFGLWTPGSEA